MKRRELHSEYEDSMQASNTLHAAIALNGSTANQPRPQRASVSATVLRRGMGIGDNSLQAAEATRALCAPHPTRILPAVDYRGVAGPMHKLASGRLPRGKSKWERSEVSSPNPAPRRVGANLDLAGSALIVEGQSRRVYF